MSKNLLIVESPAKAKTIEKYLGKDFKVLASYGHVRDLIPKEGAVDTASDFSMKYELIEKNAKHVDSIVKAAKKAEALYLATDLDREGEAISWHVYEILKEKNLLEGKETFRVVFNEITKRAIQEAVNNPRELSMDMVNAQQARRALDYLVGFNLSPLLWKKVRRGLSAGRVQSPALRLIVEREEEIERFDPREYWTLEADLEKAEKPILARLVTYEGKKLEQFDINSEALATAAREKLIREAGGRLKVAEVTSRQRKRRAAAPFITSTLQQEASRKLGFSAQKTMRTAQQLYEGVEVNGSVQGLISYMRTDSVHLAQDALNEIRQLINDTFGADQVPDQPNFYKTKQKNAQEAHEAIRPTSVSIKPADVSSVLNKDQHRLYDLIWKRTIACQMKDALINTVAVDLSCGEGNMFRANGSTIAFPGFLAVYEESRTGGAQKEDRRLPPLEKGEELAVEEIRSEQHFTEPPPRFSEASLVKALEEFGIGRPSTYAAIISTLLNREYVELDRRRLVPTDIGRVVSKFLSNHFTQYVDYEFTARLEDQLDSVSRGEREWVPLLAEFWHPFQSLVEDKTESVSRDEAVNARDLGTDPESGKPMSVRMGRYGPFVQIGTRDDEDKPKFAGLRPGQKMNVITRDEALALFDLPRELGETPEGEPVMANIGRFGPYVKYGSKFVSIGDDDDPYTIELPRALEVIQEKKTADANRIIQTFEDSDIQVLNGRYGPYVTNGKKNGKIPKDVDPKSLTFEQCEEIIAKAPDRRGRKKTGSKKAAAKKTAAKKTVRKKSTAKKKAKKKAARKTTKKKASPRKVAAQKAQTA